MIKNAFYRVQAFRILIHIRPSAEHLNVLRAFYLYYDFHHHSRRFERIRTRKWIVVVFFHLPCAEPAWFCKNFTYKRIAVRNQPLIQAVCINLPTFIATQPWEILRNETRILRARPLFSPTHTLQCEEKLSFCSVVTVNMDTQLDLAWKNYASLKWSPNCRNATYSKDFSWLQINFDLPWDEAHCWVDPMLIIENLILKWIALQWEPL